MSQSIYVDLKLGFVLLLFHLFVFRSLSCHINWNDIHLANYFLRKIIIPY